VLALATVAGISTQSRRTPAEGARPGAAGTKAPPQVLILSDLKRICSDPVGLIQRFLLVPSDEVAAPSTCYEPGKQRPASSDVQKRARSLHFVITTFPDPWHTHFSLTFDRKIEAIQQAALDADFDYDSSWLPWETSDPSFEHLNDQDTSDNRKDDREDQPGVILFRKRSNKIVEKTINRTGEIFESGLVVFVIGEEATRGIHRRQFENAAAWIKVLNPHIEPWSVGILAPTFSGSLPSLAQLLAGDTVHEALGYPQADDDAHQLRIYSGSVTGRESVELFGHLTESDDKLRKWRVHFHSFIESDDAILKNYCDYLTNTGLQPVEAEARKASRVALVSEDETAYGVGGVAHGTESNRPTDPCPWAVRVFFPRDISALRDAYQARSLFSSGSQSSENPTRSLPTDLADPAHDTHDTIRSYAGNQMAIAQEAQLFGIVSVLRDHHSEILIIRSSNVLDQIFLVQFFRRYYPDGRVAIRGSDTLFLREHGSGGISGVTMLSSYPLIPWDWREWPNPWDRNWQLTGKVNPTHRVFGEETVEGTYIATRFLLQETFKSKPDIADPLGGDPSPVCSINHDEKCFLPPNFSAGFDIPDYKVPFWAVPKDLARACSQDAAREVCKRYFRPANWISVLGRDSFYPLVASMPSSKEDPSKRDKNGPADPLSDRRFAVPAEAKLFLIGLLALAGLHAYWCWTASFTAKPAFRAHFAEINGWFSNHADANSWQHTTLIAVGSATIACSALALAWGYGAFAIHGPHPYLISLIWIVLISSVSLSFLSILASHHAARRLQKSANRGPTCFSLKWPSAGFAGAVLIFLTVLWAFEGALNVENRVPTYWRSMNLASGLCPVLPFFFLFAGIYTWFWNSLHGLAMFGGDRPLLPREDTLIDREGRILHTIRMFSREANEDTEVIALPMSRNVRWRTLVLAVGIGFLSWYVAGFRTPLRSLGSYRYGLTISVFLAVCVGWMFAETWQFVETWRNLKRLLTFLDRLPLRRTMKALRGFSWGNVWKMSGNVLDVRYRLLSRQIEILNHLNASCGKFLQDANTTELAHDDRAAIVDCREEVAATEKALYRFAEKYATGYAKENFSDLWSLKSLQERIATQTATLLTRLLIPAWRRETESLLSLDAPKSGDQSDSDIAELAHVPQHIRNAEELFCITYLGFVQNILGRLRTMALGIMWFFVAITLSVSTYPFDPRPALNQSLTLAFLVVGGLIVFVWAQMHRDSTLSRVTNTAPGELGTDFWFKIVGFGAVPLLGLISYLFPGLTDFVFSWLEPGLAAIR
jgi:hypothetical protein